MLAIDTEMVILQILAEEMNVSPVEINLDHSLRNLFGDEFSILWSEVLGRIEDDCKIEFASWEIVPNITPRNLVDLVDQKRLVHS